MEENHIVIVGGSHMDIGKIAASFAMVNHPIVIHVVDTHEELLIEKRRRELADQNYEVNRMIKGPIDSAELRALLGEIPLAEYAKVTEKPDRIPCPKPYRKNKFR